MHLQCSVQIERAPAPHPRLSGWTSIGVYRRRRCVRPCARRRADPGDSGSQRGRSVRNRLAGGLCSFLAPVFAGSAEKHVGPRPCCSARAGSKAALGSLLPRSAGMPCQCFGSRSAPTIRARTSYKPRQLSHCPLVIRNAPDVGYRHCKPLHQPAGFSHGCCLRVGGGNNQDDRSSSAPLPRFCSLAAVLPALCLRRRLCSAASNSAPGRRIAASVRSTCSGDRVMPPLSHR